METPKLDADRKSGADPEDADEYRACNIFWVPKEARWSNLKANAKHDDRCCYGVPPQCRFIGVR